MQDRHVLVVDDDIFTSYALKEHFELQGYHVTVAAGCKEAREALGREEKVDLMILDYLMPDGNGTDLLCSMAKENSLQKPQVIMSSCVINPESASWEALRARLPDMSQSLIQAYVNKPYTFDSMDAMVNLILSAAERKTSGPNTISTGDY